MRPVNMMIEVEDNVYDTVVAPHKKAKTFSKLIATLLKGYIENQYVRAYVDGTLDSMHKASVSALDDAIAGMSQSLASMGIYSSELTSVANEGKEIFSKAAEEHDESLDKVMSEMSDIREQNKNILLMLEKLSEKGIATQVIEQPKEDKIVSKGVDKKEDLNLDLGDLGLDPDLDLNIVNVEETSAEESSSSNRADEALNNMLSGNIFSF